MPLNRLKMDHYRLALRNESFNEAVSMSSVAPSFKDRGLRSDATPKFAFGRNSSSHGHSMISRDSSMGKAYALSSCMQSMRSMQESVCSESVRSFGNGNQRYIEEVFKGEFRRLLEKSKTKKAKEFEEKL